MASKNAVTIKELKVAGITVEYFDHVEIIKVVIDNKNWYVGAIPDLSAYGSSFKTYEFCEFYNNAVIHLYYHDRENYAEIFLRSVEVTIRGDEYYLINRSEYLNHGHLYNNLYTQYKNIWLKGGLFGDVINRVRREFFRLVESERLELDFTPHVPKIINIKNENCKFILYFCETHSYKTFTVFGDPHMQYIIDGTYMKSGRDDLFKYMNPDGELFTILNDPIKNEVYLTSDHNSFKLTNISNYLVKKEDKLYNGFEIISDLKLLQYKEYGDELIIYQYAHIFFAFDIENHEIVEIDMRKPNSGKHTKSAALSFLTI